ncbi:MAG: hypothetical protein A3J75_01020 [Acidobacteria bacterium RBG_16_68_9]|nr:MAG: hypothetical protein A3J75_01020 [Acidobacteria bacterium RBG_16_68_9]
MKSVDTLPSTTFSGRRFTRRQLAQVQQTVEQFPKLSRTELARTLCEHLRWTTPNGKYKVESCLSLLEALEAHGVVRLAAKLVRKTPQRRIATFENDPPDPPIDDALSAVAPIRLQAVGSSGEERERWKAYLQTYHYLGYRQPVGAHLGYFVVSEPRQQKLGCLLFSASAAWALAPRDRWIGWEDKQRKKLLHLILSNDRFLVFPWIHVPSLASHVLSLATRQIAEDWVRTYGYRPVLIETFVDPTHFAGTCYRAANWVLVGQTQGRGRLEPDHQCRTSKKDIFVYPLQSHWRQCLSAAPRAAELNKRYRNERRASRTPAIDDGFVALWEKVIHLFHEVAAQYDRKWRVRKRVIDSLILMLLIFRLVCSKNAQSYGTTIDDLWDSCEKLKLPLPQKNSIAPSSFCAARQKLDEAVFQCANQRIIAAYAGDAGPYRWLGHRLFAVDGSKINLPRELRAFGYQTPGELAPYPQGLLSCLYQLQSQLPFDFDLVSHGNERLCAMRHLEVLEENDVVVYDRGYFSYPLLHRHWKTGIHAIFRLQESSSTVIREFFSSLRTDHEATIDPSPRARADIGSQYPEIEIVPLKLRLLKYQIAGSTFCLGTTLLAAHQRYPLHEFMEVYHGRWGIEELYKVSKRVFVVEDFHARTERGVKQELFAHFVLVTMNRLFANRADTDLNSTQTSALLNPHDSSNPAPSTATVQGRKTNFKNCVRVLERGLEELLLLHRHIKDAVQRTFRLIVGRHQRIRPNRSYLRKSMRPETKWHPSKESKQKKRTQSAAASLLPA